MTSTEGRVLWSILLVAALFGTVSQAQWVSFQDETSSRLVSDPAVGVADSEEKDYAWGDVDNDGDIDLVVVRKTPFTSGGKRVNVLFLNQNGVLTDRTDDFAEASTLGGDLGFNTATNDRDVQLVDLDLDGWLDVVTATTLSDGDPKAIGHPRIYMNLGCSGACQGTNDWLGFRHEDARIPTMLSDSGGSGHNPRFCSVAAGDLTGDGYPELWFGDYDSGPPQAAGADFNDKLLINQGASNPGFFVDSTETRFSGIVQIPGATDQPFPVSAFGAANFIADMNGDGRNDIIKQTSLNNPLYVGVAYNDPGNLGFFDTFEVVSQQSPYHITIGDLNRDGKMDVVISDDGADRYMLNTGNGSDGLADFQSINFSFVHAGSGGSSSDDGFGSNNWIADLDNDNWNDVLIADVDVDIGGCTRRMHIYHNTGGAVGGTVTLQEETQGSGCETFSGNPASCVVASIPSNLLEGVHDVAVFDLDGDGWNDMVLGRCSSTEVYRNQPPFGVEMTYPVGRPEFVSPNTTATFDVQFNPFGGATIAAGTAELFVSIDGAPFTASPMVDLGAGRYEATLPAVGCGSSYEYYVSVELDQGGTFTDPVDAPTAHFNAIAAIGTQLLLTESFESGAAGWTVVNDPSLTSGAWEIDAPIGTLFAGIASAPSFDADPQPGRVNAFITENGVQGGSAIDADVDGGPTDLLSPVLDLAGTEPVLSYYRWFFSSGDDPLEVSVTNDGSTWVPVETVTLAGHNSWKPISFRLSDFVAPTSTVQVRFRIYDVPENSVTEAGIDRFRVDTYVCTPCTNDPECNDGVFCNGDETCNTGTGLCQAGSDPCPGQICDETGGVCVECLGDGDCDDGLYCNGDETCSGDVCMPGSDPCPGQLCDDVADACVNCLIDDDCDDGLFCNGSENCAGGSCLSGSDPCTGQICDEGADVCLGSVVLQPRMGDPIDGLDTNQALRFELGKLQFDRDFDENDGLGPVFNQDSCGSCHNTPLGGSGTIEVTRFGEIDGLGNFNSLDNLGGSLLQANSLDPQCAETIPAQANVVANRITPSILGFGLVEAIPDTAIQALADTPPAGVSGETHIVPVLETGGTAVGRMGFKSQVATVLTFSADAAVNEMGITSSLLPNDVPPNADLGLLALCDTVADPETVPDGQGFEFIERVRDFQRYLAPPPQTPRTGMTGETLFNNAGCVSCHVSSFTSGNKPLLEPFLRLKPVRAYSDFLLHDMGSTGDQIEQGTAAATEMRTTPLWGIRVRDPLWHDGRVSGGTFAQRIRDAIALHDDPFSEAQASAQAFDALDTASQDAIISFLDSLGRAEFDFDGDNDVDSADWQLFVTCFSGPGSFYSPDDTCAIADVDQDGDVDDLDYGSFLAASEGSPAGEIPNSLLLAKDPGGEVTLTWGDSCVTEDSDYGVYVGVIGDFTSHTPELCTTAGATTATFPAADGVYFLVVPGNGDREGSYGTDSAGTPRTRSVSACLPQTAGVCL